MRLVSQNLLLFSLLLIKGLIICSASLPVEERSNEHVIKRTYDKSGQISTLTSSLGANLTYERNEQGEIEEYQKDLRTWLFEEESFVPLALFQDGKAYSIVTDHLGTPVEAYNEQGEEVWYRRLDMNGKVIEERSMLYTSYKDYVRIPFLFQGQYYDEEIKLAYNRYRYYDPELGRYISEDPVRLLGGSNLYRYVENTILWCDPLGLSSAKLNKALGGSKKGMQAHHLIPEKVWSQNEQFLNQIGLSGQCDVSSNGLHMYNSKELAIANGKAYYHRGRHDSYSHAINRRISAIENQYHSDLQAGILSPEEARQEARQEIRKLQNRLRKVLDRDSKTNEPRRVGYKKI